MQPIALQDLTAGSVGHVRLPDWHGDLDYEAVDLLHRMTDLPCAQLRDSIDRLPAGERYYLDTLAHEILSDARICAAFA